MISRWECGERQPSKYYQTKMCKLFGKTAEELGFMPSPKSKEPADVANHFLMPLQDSQLQEVLLQLPQMEREGIITAVHELESKDVDELRRQVLQQAIKIVGMALLPPLWLPPTGVQQTLSSVTLEEFLPQCATSIRSCWHLMNGQGLAIAEEIVTTTFPTLQWEAKMHLNLGNFQSAFDALEKSSTLQPSLRGASETHIHRARVAIGLGDLELYTTSLKEGTQLALALDSQHRYQEALKVYQQTPEIWHKERQIQELAPLFT